MNCKKIFLLLILQYSPLNLINLQLKSDQNKYFTNLKEVRIGCNFQDGVNCLFKCIMIGQQYSNMERRIIKNIQSLTQIQKMEYSTISDEPITNHGGQQSYLLQSYNQNESLFANLNLHHSIIPSKNSYNINNSIRNPLNSNGSNMSMSINIDALFKKSHHKGHGLEVMHRYGTKGSQPNIGYGLEYGHSIFEDVKMLDSICQDQREQYATANKVNTAKQKNKKCKSKLYQQLFNQQQQQNQPKTKMTKKTQKPTKIPRSHSLATKQTLPYSNLEPLPHSQQHHIDNSHIKFNKLTQFVEQVCQKYSNLVRILQTYENIVKQQSEIIEEMKNIINLSYIDSQYFCKKVQTWGNQKYGVIQGWESGCWQVVFQKVKRDIVGIIQRKRQKTQFTYDNQEKSAENNNKYLNNAYRIMNCTKSVPVFVQNPQSQQTQQHQKLQQHSPTQDIVLNSNNIKKQHNFSDQSRQYITPFHQPLIDISHQIQHQLLVQFQPQPQPQPQLQLQPQPQVQITPPQGQPYHRKLSNMRIKQLESQKICLQNELRSYSYKLMVLRNENKELKDIVEGLLVEIKKLVKEQAVEREGAINIQMGFDRKRSRGR